jgi:hypothetical protein
MEKAEVEFDMITVGTSVVRFWKDGKVLFEQPIDYISGFSVLTIDKIRGVVEVTLSDA